ncbi:MAG: glycosyltransferase family 1 protein, partial [Deltaproteobacteria bacterium]
PVIASQTGPLPELALNAALFFDPFDENKIASAIEDVLAPETRNRLIQAGREQARKFSWEKSATQHYESYHRALENHS